MRKHNQKMTYDELEAAIGRYIETNYGDILRGYGARDRDLKNITAGIAGYASDVISDELQTLKKRVVWG